MLFRTAYPPLIGVALLLTAGGAVAATADGGRHVDIASYTAVGDRAVDPMSESIRAILINAGGQGDFVAKKDAGALTAFYRTQGFAPSWILNGKLTDRALSVIARIKQADMDGLNPSDYRVPHAQIGVAMAATDEALARAEVMLSQAVIDYVHDAHSGRLDPADVSQNLDYKPHIADPVEALTKISLADDAAKVLASYNPQQPEFLALRDKLAEARASEKNLPPVVPPGRMLKLGMKDPRVIILRERLKVVPPAPPSTPVASDPAPGTAAPATDTRASDTSAATGDTVANMNAISTAPDGTTVTPVSATPAQADGAAPQATPAVDTTVVPAADPPPPPFDPEVFDDSVDAAVKAFQKSAGLTPDGIVGTATLGRLNAAADSHVNTILVNMDRWRWMPENLGNFYVRVNVPNFNLDIYKDGKVIYTTRIVDGQPTKQTPIFSDAIRFVIVNPVWNVPESIAVKEMLPQIQADPGKALNGYQVFANIGGRFRPVDPWMVDWHNVDMRRIEIKQPPGERNALGSIKFMFPNPYAVYLHDTPSKSLFQRDYRALSHGCMRVMNPWDFAAVLLQHDPNVSAANLKKLVGGPQTQVNLTKPIPVHITYFTAWVDDSGKLQVRPDVYGHDARMEKALHLAS
jgi:murein L,D-transpeptidase YcbB/YkuD